METKSVNKSFSTRTMVEMALLIAVILILAFTPLGYIKMPLGLEITLIVVPVAVGSVTLGPKAGTILGIVFGITSFIQCFGMSAFGAMLLSINPVGCFVVCVIARMLCGLCSGLIYQGLKKTKMNKTLSTTIANLCCPLLNTFFFMTTLVLFFYNTDYIQSMVTALGSANVFAFVLAFVGINGLVEALICFVLGTAISKALQIALKL